MQKTLDHHGAAQLFILAVLAGPVIEELIFRGLLFNLVRLLFCSLAFLGGAAATFANNKVISVGSAIAVSALVFAWAHGETSVTVFTAHAIFGIAAAHLYFKTDTILAPMLMHVLNNFVPFSIMVLAAQASVA